MSLLSTLFEETSSSTITLIVAGLMVLSWGWWKSTRRPEGIPPGPGPALPVIGHLHLFRKDPRIKFCEWRKKYGDIFSFYRGTDLVVVLCGFQTIREALVKRADIFSCRPKSFFVDAVFERMGLSGTSGDEHKEQRRLSLEILGHLGVGHNYLQVHVLEEIGHFLQAVQDLQGKATDLTEMIHVSISNNICSIVMGKRFKYNDSLFTSCLKKLNDSILDVLRIENFNFLPFKEHLPFDPFHYHLVLSHFRFIEDMLIKPCIQEQEEKLEAEKGSGDESRREYNNFIEGYLREMKCLQVDGKQHTTINKTYLVKTLLDLWAAGMESSSYTLLWIIAHFLRHPDIQEKCQQEVDRVIGTDRPPSLQDKAETVYTEAVIVETLRFSVTAPFALPHGVSSNVMLRGHLIPEGTVVIPFLQSALQDSDVWGDPFNFRPERFISDDGHLVKPDDFIPFSLGPRVCLGRNLAYMELYLYLTSLVQRFHFLPPEDGILPSEESVMGLGAVPKPFKVRAVPRF